MDLLVYDGQGLQVRDLGTHWAFSAPRSLNLSSNPFKPEQGSLSITAGPLVWAWNGANEGGKSVPDGPYQVWLLQAGRPDLKVGFWIEHSTLALGTFMLAPQPARSQVTVYLAPPAGTQVELRVYDLSGKLMASWDLPSGADISTWDLRANSGRGISSGIYLVVACFKGPGTSQWLVRKLAVWR